MSRRLLEFVLLGISRLVCRFEISEMGWAELRDVFAIYASAHQCLEED
jgi:hypothetical protein